MINAWYFSIPSGNDDLLAKIAEKETNLKQKEERYDCKPVFISSLYNRIPKKGNRALAIHQRDEWVFFLPFGLFPLFAQYLQVVILARS